MCELNTEKVNPAKTNWLNLLPSLKGKSVLVYASSTHHSMEALQRCGCRLITCIDAENRQPDLTNVRAVGNENVLEKDAFDICIVNASDEFPGYGDTIQKRIKQSFRVLNARGILLLGFQNQCFLQKNRTRVFKMLKATGFFPRNCFLCIPSFDQPFSIFPFLSNNDGHQKAIFTSFGEECFRTRTVKAYIKDVAKYLAFKTQGTITPPWGLAFIASKNSNTLIQTELEDFLYSAGNGSQLLSAENIFYTEWQTKTFTGKQVGLIHQMEKRSKKLKLIAKKSNFQYHMSNIQKEHEFLILLNNHKSFFDKNRIVLPEPIYCRDNGSGRILTIELAVPGRPLHSKYINREKKNGGNEKVINRFIEIQGMIQTYLSENLLIHLPEVPLGFYENRLGLEWGYFSDPSRIEEYRKYVQHGDYTAVNLYYDNANDTLGIIDWDGLSSGLPPIFDLFRFFLSIGFLSNSDEQTEYFTDYFILFIRIYFKNNSFSAFVREAIIAHCTRFGFKKEEIFRYFMNFLLFLYNRYLLLFPPNKFV